VPANTFTHLAAATGAVANQFVVSTNMKVGLYTLANSGAMPTAGARHVTVTHTTVSGADTLGTIDVVGTDLAGRTISESIVPLAGTIATGALWFSTVTSVTGTGWVISGSNDTLVVGCSAGTAVLVGEGRLQAVVVNTTAAGAVTIADSRGTIAVLKSSIAEGVYRFDVSTHGYLTATLAAASDVTLIHTESMPF
jgi:hypothetical protein